MIKVMYKGECEFLIRCPKHSETGEGTRPKAECSSGLSMRFEVEGGNIVVVVKEQGAR